MGGNVLVFNMVMYLSVISIALLSFTYKRKVITKEYMYGLAYTFLLLLSMIVNQDFSRGYGYQMLIIWTAVIIATTIKFEVFMDRFLDVLCFLSLLSIVLIGLKLTIGIPPIMREGENSIDYGYLYMPFFSIMKDGTHILRNMSIFREPGCYALFLLVGLYFELYKYDFKRVFRVVTLILAAVLTLSTLSFVGLVVVFIFYFLIKGKNKNIIYVLLILLCIPFVLGAVELVLDVDIIDKVFGKFDANNASNESTVSRMVSFTASFSVYLDNLIWGCGMSNFPMLFETHAFNISGIYFTSGGNATNTMINILSMYGLLSFALVMLSIWGLSYSFTKKNKFYALIFFLFLCAIFSAQDMRLSIWFNVMVVYGFSALGRFFRY